MLSLRSSLIPFIIGREAQFFDLDLVVGGFFAVFISQWRRSIIFLVAAALTAAIQEYKGVDQVALAQVPVLDPRGQRDAQHDASRQEPNQTASVLL